MKLVACGTLTSESSNGYCSVAYMVK